jgi:hypothetical protein
MSVLTMCLLLLAPVPIQMAHGSIRSVRRFCAAAGRAENVPLFTPDVIKRESAFSARLVVVSFAGAVGLILSAANLVRASRRL